MPTFIASSQPSPASLKWLSPVRENEIRVWSKAQTQGVLQKELGAALSAKPDVLESVIQRSLQVVSGAIDTVAGLPNAIRAKSALERTNLKDILTIHHSGYGDLMCDKHLNDVQKGHVDTALRSGLEMAQAQLLNSANYKIAAARRAAVKP